jgi:hypothetical protein
MIAFALGFDAVAYLDADNWYADSHIRTQLNVQHEHGSSVICSWRIISLPDGTILERPDPEDIKKSHVDTSCFLVTREASFLAALWAQMPQKLGPICDRIFLGAALEAEPHLTWTHKRTVFFESNYKHHHRMANKIPDAPVHQIPHGLWRNIDPIEFRQRTGKIIRLTKGSFTRRRVARPPEES